MQLKLTRSQRDGGVISKHAVFMLDARVQFTLEEQRHVDRYKLWNEHIYSSESAHKSWAKSDVSADGSTTGSLKSLAHAVAAAFKLNVTVRSIYSGQHIECKSLDELCHAEMCIREACQNLRNYLDIAATFNGTEILFDYSTREEAVVATAIAPQPALITDSATAARAHPLKEPEVRRTEQAETYEDAVYEPIVPDSPSVANACRDDVGKQSQTEIDPEILKALIVIGAVVVLVLFFVGMPGMYLLKFLVLVGLVVGAPLLIRQFKAL